jgi:BMFP domain-containing protein YqiC
MECPHCNKYISSHKTHCIHCGGKIERNFIRRIWEFFSHEKIIEETFVKSLANGKLPVIKSTKQLELYIKYKVQDEEAAVIISEAFERAGREAVLEIKRGGGGKSYRVEYIPNKLPSNMSRKEVKDRIEQILQRVRNRNDLTKHEKENIQSELAQLARYHVIIWINSSSKEEFDAREQLIMNAIEAATEGITRRIEPRNSI